MASLGNVGNDKPVTIREQGGVNTGGSFWPDIGRTRPETIPAIETPTTTSGGCS